MELPDTITAAILKVLGIPGLDYRTARSHAAQLNALRTRMRTLADGFASGVPAESTYSRAYVAYNFPLNFMKARYVTRQIMALFPSLLSGDKLKVLDIGCGDGAGLLGVLYGVGMDCRAVYRGYDASRTMIRQGRQLIRELTGQRALPRIRLEVKDIGDGLLKTKERYDLIILSNSLIEIAGDSRGAVRYVERISKNLSERGIMILIEPALVATSRRVMELRDALIARGTLHILLPCLHTETCPLIDLRGGKEWCHQSIQWKPPDYLRILNQGMNREIQVLKFSYLVLSASAHTVPDGYLVISQVLKEKGKKRCYLCSPARRIELVRLNKHRAPRNSDFDRIVKGSIVSLHKGEQHRPDHLRITADTGVRLLSIRV